MLCPSCGALINDGLKYCTQCGSLLGDSATQYATAQEQSANSFNENYQPVEGYAPSQNTYQGANYNPVYTNAPVYNQAPVYQNAQPTYNQYHNPPYYNQPGYAGYTNPYAGLEKPKRNPGKVCGVLAFIFSLVGYPFLICYGAGLIYWLAALILGGVGLSVSKRNGFKNGLAKAGLILTLIPLVIGVVIGVICLIFFFGALMLEYM